MANQSPSSSYREGIEHFSSSIQSLREYVEDKHFSFAKVPEWEIPDSKFNAELSKKLNWLFRPSNLFKLDNFEVLPSSLILLLLSFIAFAGHVIYLPLFSWLTLIKPQLNFWIVVLIVFFIFSIIYSILGAYWRIYEIIVNERLSRLLKGFVLGFLLFIVIYEAWNGTIATRLGILSSAFHYPIVQDAVAKLSGNFFIILITIFFIYIPYWSLIAKSIVMVFAISFVFIVRVFQWFFWAQSTHSDKRLSEFIQQPLNLFGEESRLVDLKAHHILAIENWTNVRRQVIQNKLNFTALVFALLAVVMSTSKGDSLFSGIINLWNNYQEAFQAISENLFGWVLPLGIFSLAAIPLLIILVPFANLIIESCIFDFIVDGCAWARSVQMVRKDRSEEKLIKNPKTWFEIIIQYLSKFKF